MMRKLNDKIQKKIPKDLNIYHKLSWNCTNLRLWDYFGLLLTYLAFTSRCLVADIVSNRTHTWSIYCRHRYRHGSWSVRLHVHSSRDEISYEVSQLDLLCWSKAIHFPPSFPLYWWSSPCAGEQPSNPERTSFTREYITVSEPHMVPLKRSKR